MQPRPPPINHNQGMQFQQNSRLVPMMPMPQIRQAQGYVNVQPLYAVNQRVVTPMQQLNVVPNVTLMPVQQQPVLVTSPVLSAPPPKQSITLFVGQLSEDFKDDFVEQVLNSCGKVKSFKRPKYPFGFVEFMDLEGALRAKKIMNGLRMKDKKILVTADDEAAKSLEAFEQRLKEGRQALNISTEQEDMSLSVEQRLELREQNARQKIQLLIKENGLEPTAVSRSKSRSNSTGKRKRDDERHRSSRSHRSRSKDRRRRRKRSRSRSRRKRPKIEEKEKNRESSQKEKKLQKADPTPKRQKDLVHMIPKEPAEIKKYKVDWGLVKQSDLVEKKMRKWIDARLTEYLGGQEDAELTNYVVGLLAKYTPPETIIKEMGVVLVEDTENFVVKMWRRLIFETLKIKYNLE